MIHAFSRNACIPHLLVLWEDTFEVLYTTSFLSVAIIPDVNYSNCWVYAKKLILTLAFLCFFLQSFARTYGSIPFCKKKKKRVGDPTSE